MRLFVALDIEDEIRSRILRFMEAVNGFAPDVRWVRPESLHVTLKFMGNKSDDSVQEVKNALAAVRAESFEIAFREYGFFPNPKSARVFWVGIESGPPLFQLAKSVDDALTALGMEPEEHAYSPHLTLARGSGRSGHPQPQKGDSPNRHFEKLQKKLSALSAPEFGTMTAREFFLYESHLGSGGSRYDKLARFALA
jgi:RNA 2',3'-cyclic 3'-phosphodiesterase